VVVGIVLIHETSTSRYITYKSMVAPQTTSRQNYSRKESDPTGRHGWALQRL